MLNIRRLILVFVFTFTTLTQAETIRIMPLGDSITYDWVFTDITNPRPTNSLSGYRNYLWYQLQDEGYDVDFIGSLSAGSAVTPTFDTHNEGYPGLTTIEIANIVYNRLVQNPADVILLHIGTNDFSIDTIGVSMIFEEVQRYEDNYHHPITIVVARIINTPSYFPHITTFNYNIQNLSDTRISAGDDIVVVDMENGAGLNYATDFYDNYHPNSAGYLKMATVWFNALKNILPKEDDFSYMIPIYGLILN